MAYTSVVESWIDASRERSFRGLGFSSSGAPRRVGESPHDMILNASRSSCSTVVYLCEGWSRAAMMKRDVAEVRSEGGPLQLDEEDMVVAIPADANNVWN